jgi:hypothetical protein
MGPKEHIGQVYQFDDWWANAFGWPGQKAFNSHMSNSSLTAQMIWFMNYDWGHYKFASHIKSKGKESKFVLSCSYNFNLVHRFLI